MMPFESHAHISPTHAQSNTHTRAISTNANTSPENFLTTCLVYQQDGLNELHFGLERLLNYAENRLTISCFDTSKSFFVFDGVHLDDGGYFFMRRDLLLRRILDLPQVDLPQVIIQLYRSR